MKINVYELRTEKHLSIRKLSEKTGISKSTINDIENEETSPTLEELEALAAALDVSITDLFESPYK